MELNPDFLTILKTIIYYLGNACVFVFTTIPGLLIISIIFFTYIIAKIQHRIRAFRLAWEGTGKTDAPGFHEYLPQIWIELTEFVGKIISSLPVLLGTVATLIILMAFTSGMQAMDTFLENQKKIKELSLAIAHVKDHTLAAELEVTAQTSETTTVTIRYFDYSTQGLSKTPESHIMKGDDIYIDCLVINFDYALIEQGQKINLVVPYRIFSNKTEQIRGIPLIVSTSASIPDYYRVADTDIYGMEPQDFNKVMTDLFAMLRDQSKMKKAGIRSSFGSAVHTKMQKGEIYQIFIEQSGGLILKQKKL